MERKIYNPVQKDYVTFIETNNDTNGKRTLVEVELAAGGGVGLHYHKTYSEKFTVTEGELSVQLEKKFRCIKREKQPLHTRILITAFLMPPAIQQNLSVN